VGLGDFLAIFGDFGDFLAIFWLFFGDFLGDFWGAIFSPKTSGRPVQNCRSLC
jgi:hypothetical protein